METAVRRFFARYESCFNRGLAGEIEPGEVASLYASDFVAASPAGVMSGKNDDGLRQAMAQGYAHYRAIGTRAMRITHLALSPIDANHCLAHVGWSATYARADLPETVIAFEVHYLVQILQDEPKVFGWISGDEQALLKRHGVL
ncbi:nuclear transport factor 2 family protein [Paracoccus sp. TOH]|uniref:nuclear transport factor 2 family protein n=1 Tax=Paracoccus sp. TOH TaxID=1263728 RepID=UPI0025AFC20E|nr:nuclear transport factor 2 family protein [Paracoccus sp. TOH]WJS84996.1 nuclear transport factor 2 family protein [Paracoccus sp. TOH]